MATPVTDKAAFRIRSHSEPSNKSKGYVRSYELVDEQSQRTQVRCDLVGNAALKHQAIVADDGECWTLEPNRKVMPSQWALVGTGGRYDWQFRHKMWGKIVNPLKKTLIAVLDAESRKSLSLVDLHTAKLPVVLGLEWGKYALVNRHAPLVSAEGRARCPSEPRPWPGPSSCGTTVEADEAA